MPTDHRQDRGEDRPDRAHRRRTLIIVVVLAVAAAAGYLIIWAARPADPAPARPLTPATSTPTAAIPSSVTPTSVSSSAAEAPEPEPVPSAEWSGTDAEELEPVEDAEATVRVFLAGWLSPDPVRRRVLLGRAATPELAAELRVTDPVRIPHGPVRDLEAVGGSVTSAEFVATLADMSVRVIATADPEAPSGWYVVSIARED